MAKFEPEATSLSSCYKNMSSGHKNMAGHCSRTTCPMLGVDGANRRLARDDFPDLLDRFQRLVLDRRRRQAADMGRSDHIRQFSQLRCWHLVKLAADIHRGARDAVLAQCRR